MALVSMADVWDTLTPDQRRLMVLDHDVRELERLAQKDPKMVPELESFRRRRAKFEHERPHLNAVIAAAYARLQH
jgi:hypothetical protein